MKNTIWTSITAIICVVLVSLSVKSGLSELSKAQVEAASIKASVAADSNAGLGGGLDMGGNLGGGLDMGGNLGGDVAGDAATPGATDPATGEATGPQTPAEVVAYYNNAVNKVIASKVGYSKSRVTSLDSLEGGALLKIQLVVDMVNDFLGVGTTDYKNEKGKAEYLSKANLSVNDLTAANITEADGVYTITLGLKNGQSQASGSGATDTSPLGRSGLFAGQGDKIAFDYKNSENIHTAINGVDNCTADSAKEQVTNAKIVATIDKETGNMISLTVSWNWAVQLTNVKYTVVNVATANGTATSTVKVTDFKW